MIPTPHPSENADLLRRMCEGETQDGRRAEDLTVIDLPVQFASVRSWAIVYKGGQPIGGEPLAYRVVLHRRDVAHANDPASQVDVVVARLREGLDHIARELVARTPHAPGLLDRIATDYYRRTVPAEVWNVG